MRVLDLFSGLNGWTEPFVEHGHEVYRVDIDDRFEADIYLDINDIEAVLSAIPWRPGVILASPPCNSFSTMTMGKMWTYDGLPKHPLATDGLRNVVSTLKIIALLRPSWWVIENPRARLRSLDVLKGIPRTTITQCQYGMARMKPTDLWGVFPEGLSLHPMCRNGDPCHLRAPRGSRTGTQGGLSGIDSARIPYALADAFRVAFERAGSQSPVFDWSLSFVRQLYASD